MTGSAWNLRGDALVLSVRLTPKSSRDEIGGLAGLADGRMVLQVRVRAVPEAGAANEALLRLLAKTLHMPVRSLRLESGATSRVKTLLLTGDTDALQAALAGLCIGDGRVTGSGTRSALEPVRGSPETK